MNDSRLTSAIFDMDGTLVDSLPGIEFSVKAAFEACALPYSAMNLRSIIGPPIRSILAKVGSVTDPRKLDNLVTAFRNSYDSEGWRNTTCYPGVERSLASMHDAGHRLFVVTNKPRHITLTTFESQGILQLFEAVVTRDSRTPPFSTKGEMLEFLISSRALATSDCVFVGDTREDADAAHACALRFAFVTYGYGTLDAAVPVRHIVDSFSQIPQLLTPEFAHD